MDVTRKTSHVHQYRDLKSRLLTFYRNSHGQDASTETAIPDWTIYDADFFALPWLNESDQGLQDFLQPGRHTLDGENLADIPLFPMYDQMGGSFM